MKGVDECGGRGGAEDRRGHYSDPALSALMPRRLITLAPTIDAAQPLETLVAAYCPLPEEGGGTTACGDVVVLRGGHSALSEGLSILEPLLPESMPAWVWWNGCIDEAPELMQRLNSAPRRLIIDTALGDPHQCLELLRSRVESGQAGSDRYWLRLPSWCGTPPRVFPPPQPHHA